MCNPISISKAAVCLLGAIFTIQAAAAQLDRERPLSPYFAFCRSVTPMGNTYYFSATRPIDAGVALVDLEGNFRDYLRMNYKYPNTHSVECYFAFWGDLQARTESSRQTQVENLHSAKIDVVETDWTYKK